MGTKNYWLGGGTDDNDWQEAANWSLGAAPVDTNDAVFDGRGDGTTIHDCTVNMANGAIDLDSLHIMESYTGTIGAANAPLEIEISGDLLIEGTGSYYIQSASAGATTNGAIDRTIINTTGSVFLSSLNNDATYTTKFATVIVNAGTVTVYGDADKATTGAESGTVITDLYLDPTFGRSGGVTVTIGDLCYNIAGALGMDIIMAGGTCNLHSQAKVIDQFGGTITHGNTSYSMGASDDSISTLNLHDGTFNWQPSVVSASVRTTAAAAPAITTANIYGGTFDASGMLEKVTTDPTITTMYLHEGATLNLDNGYANFILTTLKDYGGNILHSSGQSLTIT